MDPETELSDRLRDRILNALHLGLLHPGDRLPSIRTLWREMGVDHRVVAAAYRTLEAEGLVQVRGRSGVYVAPQEHLGGELLAETARWMAGVLVEGWKRRIAVPDMPELLRRCTGARRLRCAVVESSQDQMAAYRAELEDQFGIDTVPLTVSPVPLPRPERSVEFYGVQDALREVDLVVTTFYHGRMVRAAADAVGTPAVTVTVAGDVVETLQRHLRDGELTVVCVDPVFGERMRSMYEDEIADPAQVRVVLADDTDGLDALPADEPVLLTGLARERLGDVLPNPVLLPHSPTFSARSAMELLETVIRLNLQEPRPREHEGYEAVAASR